MTGEPAFPAALRAVALVAYPFGRALLFGLAAERAGASGESVGLHDFTDLCRGDILFHTIRNSLAFTAAEAVKTIRSLALSAARGGVGPPDGEVGVGGEALVLRFGNTPTYFLPQDSVLSEQSVPDLSFEYVTEIASRGNLVALVADLTLTPAGSACRPRNGAWRSVLSPRQKETSHDL